MKKTQRKSLASEKRLALRSSERAKATRDSKQDHNHLGKCGKNQKIQNQHRGRCGSSMADRDGAGTTSRVVHDNGHSRDSARATSSHSDPASRVPSEPGVPKKPPSAFLLYCRDAGPRIKSENPKLLTWMRTCILGQLWRDKRKRDKRQYFELAAKLRKQHHRLVAEYGAYQRACAHGSAENNPNPEAGSSDEGKPLKPSSAGRKTRTARKVRTPGKIGDQ